MSNAKIYSEPIQVDKTKHGTNTEMNARSGKDESFTVIGGAVAEGGNPSCGHSAFGSHVNRTPMQVSNDSFRSHSANNNQVKPSAEILAEELDDEDILEVIPFGYSIDVLK